MPTIKPKLTTRQQITRIVYWFLRVVSVFYVMMLFLPAVNPGRITANINRNLSLLTSGFFHKTLIAGMERGIQKGWMSAQALNIDFVSCMACCIGAILAGVGGCMSIGNNKLKRFASLFSVGGGAVGALSVFGIVKARNILVDLVAEHPNYAEKTLVTSGNGALILFAVISVVIFVCGLAVLVLNEKPAADEKFFIEPKYRLFLMFMPFALLVFVFAYLPLWGWRYSFFDYKAGQPLSMNNFVGFKWFGALVRDPAYAKLVGRVMINTLAMSGIGLATSWLPMVFAVFLSEIKSTRVRRIIQTCTTLPNFISWVLVYAVALCIFSTDGFLSSFMVQNGFWDKGRNLLMSDKGTWFKMWAWGTWKGLGWSAIIYISAISGIDQQLYEAATVDGAGRFQKMWHVTLPELIPTYCVLLTLSIAGILSNGMEQYFCFENALNSNSIQVLDLYVYKIGIGSGLIPLSTVVGMLKSVVSVVLLFFANNVSKMIRGTGVV